MATDTGAEDFPVALLDTSAAIALLVEDHEAHAATLEAVRGRRLGLAGHAWFETYSVLTRLPHDRVPRRGAGGRARAGARSAGRLGRRRLRRARGCGRAPAPPPAGHRRCAGATGLRRARRGDPGRRVAGAQLRLLRFPIIVLVVVLTAFVLIVLAIRSLLGLSENVPIESY